MAITASKKNFRKGQFRTKQEATQRAKKIHCCTACLYADTKKFDTCPQCGAEGKNGRKNNMRVYFPSQAEHVRAVDLIFLLKAGKITGLKFHERFNLEVNGKDICVYEADSSYFDVEKGVQVVEDVKPESTDFMFELAKYKIALFEALYCLPSGGKMVLNIYRRKHR